MYSIIYLNDDSFLKWPITGILGHISNGHNFFTVKCVWFSPKYFKSAVWKSIRTSKSLMTKWFWLFMKQPTFKRARHVSSQNSPGPGRLGPKIPPDRAESARPGDFKHCSSLFLKPHIRKIGVLKIAYFSERTRSANELSSFLKRQSFKRLNDL